MSCLTCSAFDSNYHGGYCDYHKCDTSPSDSCSYEDNHSRSYSSHNCQTCYYFDSHYHGGYCDNWKEDVNPSSSCDSYTD